MLAYWRARGYAIEDTRQGRTQKLRAHYANILPWNQEGPVPFPERYPRLREPPDRIGPLWGLPSRTQPCVSGSTDRLPRIGKHRGLGQSAGAAAVSAHPLIGSKVFSKNEILQRINVTLFQRVTVIALHVRTLAMLNRVPVLASWRDNAVSSHGVTVLPLHGMTFRRL